jgi:hypothetical protein
MIESNENEPAHSPEYQPPQQQSQPSSREVPQVAPGHYQRPMPSDVAVFLHLLPNIVGSIATKYSDAKTIRDLSINLARETTGQLVALGICQRTTLCLDSYPLAAGGPIPQPQPGTVPALGNNNGHGTQGAMVAHFLSQETRKVPTL